MPNFDYTVWTGLFVQKGVPSEIVRRLEADVGSILGQPDIAKNFDAFGAIPGNETLERFVARIKRDTEMNEAIVRKADVSLK